MRRLGLSLIAFLALTASVAADSGLRRVPCGYQQITTVSSAVALTVPTTCGGAGVNMATIIPEAQAVRWRDDDTDPSATVGMPLAVGVVLVYEGTITKIKFFEQAGGAKLNVSYYR